MDLLTIEEAKKRLGVSDSTLRRWMRKGKIKAQLIEHRYYFRAEDVDRLLPKQKDTDALSQRLGNAEANIETLHQETAKLRQEIEDLKTAVQELSQRAQRHEKTTMKEKAVSSPVKRDTDQHTAVSAPAGDTIAATLFAEQHGVNRRTMGDYLAGKNQWNDRIDSIVIGRSGPNPVHGLTPAQQYAAIDFFQRHHVSFRPCPQCPHEPVQEQE